VLARVLLTERGFQGPCGYGWKAVGEVGRRPLVRIGRLSARQVMSSEAELGSLTRLWSGHLGARVQGSSALDRKPFLAAGALCEAPQVPGIAVTGHPPVWAPLREAPGDLSLC